MTAEHTFQTLPAALESERLLLAAFLQYPVEVGGMIADYRLTTGHFHNPANARIFGALMHRWTSGLATGASDIIPLTQHFTDIKQLEEVGGAGAITELGYTECYPSVIPEVIRTITEKAALRSLVSQCHRAIAQAMASQDDPERVIHEAQIAISGVQINRPDEVPTFREIVKQTMVEITTGKTATADILSGIKALDEILRLKNGRVTVIAGLPGSGKSALALNIATKAAMDGKRVAIFSLEMPSTEVCERMLSYASGVPAGLVAIDPTEWKLTKLDQGMRQLAPLDVALLDDVFELGQIAGILRQLHAQKPLDLVVIDYLQLVEHRTQKKEQNRQEIVTEISRTLKRIAQQSGFHLIELSQLTDDGKLRESRAIGQDANNVISVKETDDGGRELFIVKQRGGRAKVSVEVDWIGHLCKFIDKQ